MGKVYLGTIEIAKAYMGTTLLTKFYLGGTQIDLTPAETVAPTVGTLSSVTRTNWTTATLIWTAASDNVAVTGYKIYRSSGAADSGFTLLKTVGNVLTTTDTLVDFDETYYYYVTAIDGSGNESSASNHIAVAIAQADDKFFYGTPISYINEGTVATDFIVGRFATITADSTDKQIGTYSARFNTVGTDVQQYRTVIIPFASTKKITLRFWAKASETSKSFVRIVQAGVTKTTIDINATTWTEYEVTFTSNATAGDASIHYYTAYNTVNGTETLWVDGFRLYEEDYDITAIGLSPALIRVPAQNLSTWTQRTFDITPWIGRTGRLVVEATRGSSFTGDIQIDDMSFGGTTYDPESGTNSFERDSAVAAVGKLYTAVTWTALTTATSGNGLWLRDNLGTASSDTGNTSGNTGDYYYYIETGGGSTGSSFWLRSPSITINNGTLSLYTAQNGATCGTINVYLDISA